MTVAPLDIYRADERGRTQLDWLDSRHTFSFGGYQNPDRMGFRSLRVINDDRVAPGGGFGEHGHRDMEILTWVLDGGLAHRDSLGHESTIRPGDLQAMTAGSGIRHSEFNASKSEPVHFLQIWLLPEAKGLEPRYEQKRFEASDRRNRWRVIASRDGREDSVRMHQDALLHNAVLDRDVALPLMVNAGRFGYLHVATGEAELGQEILAAGDGIAFTGPLDRQVRAATPAELLLFDLG
jgi:redox-sensitive bicupin YhaK (pirin superfamily)